MANPFLKKNPFMSIFLSSANRMAATARGQVTAQANRQIRAAVTKATNENLKAMLGAAEVASAKPKAKPKAKATLKPKSTLTPKPRPKPKPKAKNPN